MEEHDYRVVVDNLGTVCRGGWSEATAAYRKYVDQSASGKGRAAYEQVTLLQGDRVVAQFNPIGIPLDGDDE